MFRKIISYFAGNHLLTNFIVLFIFAGSLYYWQETQKEEMPNVEFPFVRISASYSGATPSEVEYFITKPIEDAVKGIDGVFSIRSTSSTGSSSVFVELDQDLADMSGVVTDIKSAVADIRLPADVRNDPHVRHFKTGQRSVIDLALYNTNARILTPKLRHDLQNRVLALENRLTSLAEVSAISLSGYYAEEMLINLNPQKLKYFNIPVSSVISKINAHNLRQPVGTLEDEHESKVTLSGALYEKKDIESLIIRGTFEGEAVRLKDLATITNVFKKQTTISKVNGYEAVILNVTKSTSTGILEAVSKIKQTSRMFEKSVLKNSPYKTVAIDDESKSVKNRLSIIVNNGIVGFALIIFILFVFLDMRSGIWVAVGIPFSFAFTMIAASLAGYTINNMTLAAVIIVMGMIVDDAIVVAENITRVSENGFSDKDAAVLGTEQMFLPITASILTTCIAFVPLLLMGGRWSRMNRFLPPVIFFMLGASLIESVFILPGHMTLPFFKKKGQKKKKQNGHWFTKYENLYGKVVEKIIKKRGFAVIIFLIIFAGAALIFTTRMKYEMFPREEADEIRLFARTPEGTSRYQTAIASEKLENIFSRYLHTDITAYRTYVARGRRGGAAYDNELSMRIELKPREKRKKSLNDLIQEWETETAGLDVFQEIRFMRQRWGSSSGSPVEIKVLGNNDTTRRQAVDMLFELMNQDPHLINAEIEREMVSPEYELKVDHDLLSRLNISPSEIASTLRTILSGYLLYEIPGDEEEKDLKVSVEGTQKNDITKLMDVPIENRGNYLVPLKNIVTAYKKMAPASISREDYKRVTKIYADIFDPAQKNAPVTGQPEKKNESMLKNHKSKKASQKKTPRHNEDTGIKKKTKPGVTRNDTKKLTPLEVAERYEKTFFPQVLMKYPSIKIQFGGEIKDSRETQGEFKYALIMVIFLIYMVLALLFHSLTKPLIIMLSIPFGVVGVIFAFTLHGINVYGFFAVVGILGLSGVVVNDSIVMLSRLKEEFEKNRIDKPIASDIAGVAKTRLRAVILTTLTTVAGLFPTAYGVVGYDSMLAEMMLAMGWGLLFGTSITLILVPVLYSFWADSLK